MWLVVRRRRRARRRAHPGRAARRRPRSPRRRPPRASSRTRSGPRSSAARPTSLVLTIASAMSASHDAAAVAARDVGEHARVVDTMTAAGAQALVVLAAARARRRRRCRSTTSSRVATDVAARVRLVATVPDLEHLVRSGRVPGIAGWAGRTLGHQPAVRVPHRQGAPAAPGARGRRRLRPAGRALPSRTPAPDCRAARRRAPRAGPRGRGARCSTESATPTRWSRSSASSAR